MAMDVRIIGVEEVRAALMRLTSAAALEEAEAALKEAAEPIVQEARARAPTDAIRQGIRLIQVVRKEGGSAAEIGLPGGRHPWFMGLWIEKGTGPRTRKSGGSTGSMPASPFLRPAFEAKRQEAAARYFEALKRRLERA